MICKVSFSLGTSLLALGGGREAAAVLAAVVQGRVDPARVADVLEHDLALVQRGLAETELQQLQVPDLLFRLVGELGQEPVGQQGPVLVDKQLLGPVYVDQHGDYVRGSPAPAKANTAS